MALFAARRLPTSQAPEVFLREPYNEKCDVFSFGVLAFELFSRQLLLTTYVNTDLGTGMGVRTPRDFAKKVGAGKCSST